MPYLAIGDPALSSGECFGFVCHPQRLRESFLLFGERLVLLGTSCSEISVISVFELEFAEPWLVSESRPHVRSDAGSRVAVREWRHVCE